MNELVLDLQAEMAEIAAIIIKGARLNYFRHLPGFADGVPTAVP